MKEEVEGREIMENMQYLKELLHQEWERSGITTAEVIFPIAGMEAVNKRVQAAIGKSIMQTENREFTFKHSMDVTKECYLLLRLARKIKKAEEISNKKQDKRFIVKLDREEYGVFQCLFQTEGR